ncbi:MAG: hypothetical protein A4E49_01962 [Methanosaeta sp. PtaU1.Bin112]|nr:MAG: hypothetical protein A4E49_01962 [Methanosaeta sp. PtaU1.Bin112]
MNSGGELALNNGRLLVKINRISAWMLLVFMILFLISGYAWWNRILLPLKNAIYIHTNLDIFLVFFFLVHVLISVRFALARWRVGHVQAANLLLIIIGILSFGAILSIR